MASWRMFLAAALALALATGCREGGAGADDDPIDAGAGPDGTPADADPGAHPGEVWVMAWNIQTFPKSVSTVARVAQILESMPVDVVGVEEIDDNAAFTQLDDMLPDYVGLIANDPFGDTRVGLLYRSATVTVDDIETLFPDDQSAFPRPPLSVHVTAQGIDFHVLVLHLKALGDADSEARRKEAVLKLDAYLQGELAAAPDARYLLMGDWNDELTDPVADNVFQPMLANPDDYTFLSLPLAEMPSESTYIPFPSFIDHMMLTTNGLGVWGDGSTTVLHLDATDTQYESTVSDHRPLLTKFRPAPPAP